MKFNFSIVLISIVFLSSAQSRTYAYLDSNELQSRFNEKIMIQYGIEFPIFRVYEFEDVQGRHELVLTEKPSQTKFSDNDSIKAFCFLVNDNVKELEWQLSDFIIKPKNSQEETSIWFWTKHLRLEDFDDNGIVDPLVVYGTTGEYGTEDGRLKILIYLNGIKYGIRHQNSEMDFGRNTKVDKSYYELSPRIQTYVSQLMRAIQDSGKTIFPAGWEDNMKKKKLYFDEN